ncbi:MAG TPA: D-2-hydroxyacid dehydrogenase family protein [Stellaceae bacterium]|nr:D-2-hydroxyacid dehydrogenase family protein [Stellaceae bacterium]
MKIVIPDDYQDTIHKLDAFKLLAGHEVTRYRTPARDLDELVERLHPAECIVEIRERIDFSRVLIERLPNLRLIALVGSRSQAIDYEAAKDHQVLVSTGKSGSPEAPAELAMALMLTSRRNVAVEAPRMRAGEWPTTLSYRLRGSTLGVFGLGKIGQLVAAAGRGLGMQVLVWGRENSLKEARAAGYETAGSKAELFERADVLQLLVRLTAETRGIVTAADLARMKPTALFVNVARAQLIEPGALVEALANGRPGFAAVDVYDEEPIVGGNHPLLKMPSVLCTPHLGWAEWDTFELYFRECFEQIVNYAEGKPLRLA